MRVVQLLAVLMVFTIIAADEPYILDDSVGLGRRYDGIGGLSGGGATSRLLVSYPQVQRDQILDLLFKPKFGASLHILKVEIGGDAQSTDGSESSHMHTASDENYHRGYEWWLMTEAKKRNPDIKLYGLSWAYPAWVGNGSGSPYTYPDITAGYITKWIQGALKYYNLTIDYVGIWNERSYNKTYIKTLRKMLDSSGLSHVEIVAADGSFAGISADMLVDKELNASVSIVGAHYPGTHSDAAALATKKPLWASEDYSTFNDDVGAGCWARILNQNYVNGNMTSTISWNLIASYYNGLPYFRDGLMTAIEPWSGHYEVMGPVWVSAHTTQFSLPGYYYLKHNSGAGHLDNGGSYVTLMDSQTKDFTIVIETMSHDHSKCIRPSLPPYTVKQQNATFLLRGSLAKVTQLSRWNSYLSFNSGTPSRYFEEDETVKVEGGQFIIHLPVDSVVTLSTLSGQQKGSFDDIPLSRTFPVPYNDSFNSYLLYSEARYFADQSGVFEIAKAEDASHGNVMRQVVPTRPITWCDDANQPFSIIGNITWQTAHVKVSVLLEAVSTSAFVAAKVDKGGCGSGEAKGVFFWISSEGFWNVTSDLAHTKTLASGSYEIIIGQWYTLEIYAKDDTASVSIDGHEGATVSTKGKAEAGYVGIGTGGFYSAQFDDFYLLEASSSGQVSTGAGEYQL